MTGETTTYEAPTVKGFFKKCPSCQARISSILKAFPIEQRPDLYETKVTFACGCIYDRGLPSLDAEAKEVEGAPTPTAKVRRACPKAMEAHEQDAEVEPES